MTLAFLYYFFLLLWALLSLYWGYRTDRAGGFVVFAPVGANLIAFVLFVIVGLALFGWPVKG